MKRSFAPALLFFALAARGAEPVRAPATGHPIRSAPYPPEAARKKIEGNVVLTGNVTAAGQVTGLRSLASSAPELTATALDFVSRWTFTPASEDGKPVPVTLNVVVRFRKDSHAQSVGGPDPGTLAQPIAGDIVLSPSDAQGKSKRLEGFAVERGDEGIAGLLELDLPRSTAAKSYRVAVTDGLPAGGRILPLLDQTVTGGGNGGKTTVSLAFHRSLDPDAPAERGAHLVKVTVDGREAGGGVYWVVGARAPAKPKKK